MISINDKNFEFKYSLRSMFIWETITDKPFEIKTLMDTYVFAYACLVSNKDNPVLEFNDFIDYCDQDPTIITKFNEFLEETMKARSVMGSKKKVTRKKKN